MIILARDRFAVAAWADDDQRPDAPVRGGTSARPPRGVVRAVGPGGGPDRLPGLGRLGFGPRPVLALPGRHVVARVAAARPGRLTCCLRSALAAGGAAVLVATTAAAGGCRADSGRGDGGDRRCSRHGVAGSLPGRADPLSRGLD